MKKILITILAIVMVLVLIGCTTPPKAGTYIPDGFFDPDGDIETKNFQSVKDLKDFLKANGGGSTYYDGFFRGGDIMMETMDMAVSSPTMVKTTSAGGSNQFSETNVQVAGIDEADIIKTDGDYIYTVTGETLFIIKAYPGEDAEIVSTIKFDHRPSSIFLNGDKLAVFGNFYDLDYFKLIDFTPRSGVTYFDVYDISDKEEPELVKEYKFEGRYFQGRMMGDYVYLVLTSSPDYRSINPTPLIIEDGKRERMAVSDIAYFNIPYRNPQFATVHAINIDDLDEDLESKTITIDGSPSMYMSAENLYIVYTEWINEYDLRSKITIDLMMSELTDYDREIVRKIKNTDDDVLSPAEKEQKILRIVQSYINYLDSDERDAFYEDLEDALQLKLEEYEYMEFTIINKISVDDGEVEVVANGKVPGHVINQFSMDEYRDVFRIGTTVNARWSSWNKDRTESTNHVLTLDKDLDILDHLEDLAEGERIYATRFMGEKLYMVTFRQVDPFFVIDLSNPNNIKNLGELKIPGFSRYLHPYDENTIIGIGRDATETGRQTGLKISLFDVSDPTDPKEIAKFTTGDRYSSSVAEFEHKAFLFNKEKELLVIPAYSYDWKDDDGYNGAMVFKITKDDIEVRGIIDHSDGNQRYGAAVERSLFIEELLYTKSANLLRINELDDLSSVKNIKLTEVAESGDIPVF